MTDQFDRASELEQGFRDIAITNARKIPSEMPDEHDGKRWCLACGTEIPQARLAAISNAVRCAECQSLKELRSHRRG